jgi:UDP-2,4-diacetamido-2,4,6-trideoxy-beta-L-altropyranose hydrolase
MSDLLLLRADASGETGAGHVMRCLALAQAWQDASPGGRAVFVAAECPPALEARLAKDGCELHFIRATPGSSDDAAATLAVAKEIGASHLVLDGYRFDDAYEMALGDAGVPLLAFDDDGHAGHTAAQLVLNQNLHARPERYAAAQAAGARLVLGPRFACLRREVRQARARPREVREAVERVLVLAGGSDPHGVSEVLTQAVLRAGIVAPDELHVIIGGADAQANERAARVEALGARAYVSVANVAEHMVGADLALSAAGSTTWELMCLGVPSLLVFTAANQRDVAAAAAASRGALDLGGHVALREEEVVEAVLALAEDPTKRRAMAAAGRALVDGQGACRVAAALRAPEVLVRPATHDDAELLYRWANDPSVRAASFSSEPLPWETHVRWLEGKLDDPGGLLFIGCLADDRPLGQVRFDLDGAAATISVSLDRELRGAGQGRKLIAAGCEEVFRTTPVRLIRARIKPENAASARAFQAAGFERVGEGEGPGHGRALDYELRRGEG